MALSRDNPMMPTICRVVERRQENDDTFTLTLQPDGEHGRCAPGQFNMVYVFGVGEIPISMSGRTAQEGRMVHTTRRVGTVTAAMGQLAPGDTVGVRGPFGTTWPLVEAEGGDVLLVAGGIGLAPLRPALYHLLEHRSRYGRIVLLYGARTQEDLLYRAEVEQWRARFDVEIFVTVDRATGEWRGNVGLVTALIPRAPCEPRRTVAMVCGPEVMMRATAVALRNRGVAATQLYLSLERNMKCAVGTCGHCQLGPFFVCHDGPVFRYDHIEPFLTIWEV